MDVGFGRCGTLVPCVHLEMTPETQVKNDLKKALSLVGVTTRAITVGLGGKRGMPDRGSIIEGHAIWFEAKREGAKPTPNQEKTHRELREDGATVFVVYPSNIEWVVRQCVEIREHYRALPRWVCRHAEERLFPVPEKPAAGTRRDQKRSPARPTLSRGTDDPEQHRFAAAIGYRSPEQDQVGIRLADPPRTQAIPVADLDG